MHKYTRWDLQTSLHAHMCTCTLHFCICMHAQRHMHFCASAQAFDEICFLCVPAHRVVCVVCVVCTHTTHTTRPGFFLPNLRGGEGTLCSGCLPIAGTLPGPFPWSPADPGPPPQPAHRPAGRPAGRHRGARPARHRAQPRRPAEAHRPPQWPPGAPPLPPPILGRAFKLSRDPTCVVPVSCFF